MALTSWEASKRDFLDDILNKFGKRDKLGWRKSSKDDKEEEGKKKENKEDNNEEEEEARKQVSLKRMRGETALKSKRMRNNAGNAFRQEITVINIEDEKGFHNISFTRSC